MPSTKTLVDRIIKNYRRRQAINYMRLAQAPPGKRKAIHNAMYRTMERTETALGQMIKKGEDLPYDKVHYIDPVPVKVWHEAKRYRNIARKMGLLSAKRIRELAKIKETID